MPFAWKEKGAGVAETKLVRTHTGPLMVVALTPDEEVRFFGRRLANNDIQILNSDDSNPGWVIVTPIRTLDAVMKVLDFIDKSPNEAMRVLGALLIETRCRN